MKKIFTLKLLSVIMLVITSSLCKGQANTSLSNLVSPTAVNVSLLPKNNNNQNLGSNTKSWKSLYLDSNIYLKDSLFIHNEGIHNTFIGENSAKFVGVGASQNTGIGAYTLHENILGYENTAVGNYSMYRNTTGIQNTAVGALSLRDNNGICNTAFGFSSLQNNKTGAYNVAIGYYALISDTSGNDNTAMGRFAMYSLSNGNQNTAIGSNSLYNVVSGYNNTALGFSAGSDYKGNNNTFLGALTNPTGVFSNSTAIGYNAQITANNQVRIGNSSITSIVAGTGYVIYSDGRFKKNIKENVPGLEFINLLKPVTYNYDVHGLNAKINGNNTDTKKGNYDAVTAERRAIDEKAISEKERKIYTGLVAQDVEKAANKLGYTFSGVYHPQNDNDLYGLSYSDFVMPLIKAVQELSKKNDDKDSKIELQNERIDVLQKEINELKSMIVSGNQTSTAMKQMDSFSQSAKLEQNQPNPTASSTTIKYFIPEQTVKAVIKITNSTGQEIKLINLSKKSNAQISVQTNDLTAGSYFYSLVIDGKTGDTKKMIVAH